MTRGAADVHSFHVANGQPGPRQVIGIGIPSFGMVSLYWAARLLALRMPMNTIARYFYVVGQEVGAARNQIVHLARQIRGTGPGELRCTHLLFLDDDVLFHPDLLITLLGHDLPMVSGLYYTKATTPQPLMFKGENEGLATGWRHGDMVPVSAHGMGLCLINLDVFDAIEQGHGDNAVYLDVNGYPAFFTTTRDQRNPGAGITNETEDVYFCRLARGAGVVPMVDTSAPCFGFHFDGATQRGYPRPQWDAFTKTGAIEWPGPDGPILWEAGA